MIILKWVSLDLEEDYPGATNLFPLYSKKLLHSSTSQSWQLKYLESGMRNGLDS